MAKLLLAKEVNVKLIDRLLQDKQLLQQHNVVPKLATVRIGNVQSDISYEKGATKKMFSLGFETQSIVLPDTASEKEIISVLEKLSCDNSVHGILLFQPLPEHLDEEKIRAAICPVKDIDCANVSNLGAMLGGEKDGYPYCSPTAVMELIDHYNINLENTKVAIVGSDIIVGKPLSMMLVDKMAAVTLCGAATKNLSDITKNADIIITCTGIAGFITKEHVKKGQIVIDAGITYLSGKIYGDVDMEQVIDIVDALTPTPGGISGITTTILAMHLVKAAKQINNI